MRRDFAAYALVNATSMQCSIAYTYAAHISWRKCGRRCRVQVM